MSLIFLQYIVSIPALILVMILAVMNPDLIYYAPIQWFVLISIGIACVIQFLRHRKHAGKLGAPQQNPYSG